MISLNLLPKEQKNALKSEILARLVILLAIFIFIWGVLFLGGLTGARFFFDLPKKEVEGRIRVESVREEVQEAQEMEQRIRGLNSQLARIKNIHTKRSYDIYLFLTKLAEIMPQGAYLSGFAFDVSRGEVKLTGHADFRSQVLALEEALKEEGLFQKVEAPLENLLRAEDINFNFTLKLNEEYGS